MSAEGPRRQEDGAPRDGSSAPPLGRRTPAQRAVTLVRHPRAVAGRLLHVRRDRRVAAWHAIQAGEPRLITVRSKNGRITFDSRDTIIGPSLYLQGNWEHDLMRRTVEALRTYHLVDPRRRTLVDVGANIGTTTVAFLRDRVFDDAIAIEPEPANFDLLQRNVRQNDLTGKVVCLRVALGEVAGSTRLALSPTNFGDHRIHVSSESGHFGEESWETVEVPVERLDDIVGRQVAKEPSDIALVWMDVQGYEGHVLLGARDLIAADVPVELEFWPYGLARAGTPRDTFLGLVSRAFTRFVDLRDPALAARSIEEMAGLYDRYVGPDGATELLLMRGGDQN
jgi:FkbM family methyltransferase